MKVKNLTPYAFTAVSGFVVFMALASLALGQSQSQYDKGTPPQHAVGVSSLGSYTSTELGTINLSNGGLNFKIPLATIGGRGGISLPITLNYSSKVWSASMDTDFDRFSTQQQVAYADYDVALDQGGSLQTMIGAGWTLGIWPGLEAKRVLIGKIFSGPNVGCYSFTLTKLTLYLPDRGEVELRDDATNGAPLPSVCSAPASRGTRWHATDGSGLVFINDVDNGVAQHPVPNYGGVVILADGTRIRVGGNGTITDRNGNKIVGLTDQLGRTHTIQTNVSDPEYPHGPLAWLITIPGYDGQNRYYKIKKGVMNDNYRSDIAPAEPVITGDWDPEGWGYDWWGTPTKLFAKSYGLYAQRIDDLEVLTELVLPDGRSLKFKYNQYGEVAEVVLPTGGKVQYDHGFVGSLPTGNSPLWETGTGGTGSGITTDVKQVDRAVQARRTYPDGVTLEGKWNYGYGGNSSSVSVRSSSNVLLSDEIHYFMPAGRYTEYPNAPGNSDGSHYSLWSTGVEWRSETRNASGVVIAATEQDWTQRTPLSWAGYPQEQPAKDNRVNQHRQYLENGMMSRVETLYDQYNNPTEVKEFDFDQTLKRRTTITYADSSNLINGSDYTLDSIRLLRLPLVTTVFDGNGSQAAQTVNEYDNYADDFHHAPLQNYGTVTGHDANYGPAYTTRGNLTRAGRWLNLTNSFIYTYPRYDKLGNLVSAKDANGNVSSISFADDFGNGSNPGTGVVGILGPTYALPTLIMSPPPSPGAPAQTARSQYDFSTGLLTGFKDRNGVVTQTLYNDPFNRPTLIKTAIGVMGVEAHAAMYYAPATLPETTLVNNDVLTVRDQTTISDATLRSWTRTDGFGRTTQAWSRDSQGDVQVMTLYDALGRPHKQSNPFRPSLAGEIAVFTTTTFDLAGRVTAVTTPDNAVVSTNYNANAVTVTDPAGKQRRSLTDALGRLVRIDEPDANGNLGPAESPAQPTNYSYDPLGNLRLVTQGQQQRFFMYDSLSRLIRARNPEQEVNSALNLTDSNTTNSQWSSSYSYDSNGNLLATIDARNVTTSYVYDALNRTTSRSYSDGTPAVAYNYDSASNGKGRLASISSSVSTYNYSGYDPMGRVLGCSQTIGSRPYPIAYTYDLAGHVKSTTYPSGNVGTYAYDNAGRLNSFTGNLGEGGASRNYATAMSYSPLGGMTEEKYGTDTSLYNKRHYNVRGQLYDTRLSTIAWATDQWHGDLGAISNWYDSQTSIYQNPSSGPDNNGNLRRSQIIAQRAGNTYAYYTDDYTYDSLNRLKSITEYRGLQGVGATLQFEQIYDYDPYGNRTIREAPPGAPEDGINRKQFTVNTANNRLGVPANQTGAMTYDAAGNLTTDTYSGWGMTRVYDAENRMTSETQANNFVASYSYDGDGRRVKRTTAVNGQPSSLVETWQVYGIGGELLAEYQANGAPTSPRKEYGYRNGQLLVTAEPSASIATNVALVSNGAVATASSSHNNFPVAAINDGEHRGLNWGFGGGWNDNTANAYPDSVEINFGVVAKTINEISVFTLQDNLGTAEPTESMTFSQYGITAFDVQHWNGSSWVTVPNGSVTGNNKVWRRFTFAPITTTKIRVVINGALASYSRIIEVEAWTGTPPVPATTNFALAANGGAASASTQYNASYPPAATINGDRKAFNWNFGGGWNDGTAGSYPDWLQVDFGASRTINEIDVFTIQDIPSSSVEPTENTMFSLYGITSFEVQYWNGSNWVTVPGGSVTGNNEIWRRISFAAITTSKIRVLVTGALASYSRIAELEAWGPTVGGSSGGGSGTNIRWLVTDHLGTPRMIFDKTGSLASVSRHDYLPFGEELSVGTGGRTTDEGYTPAGSLAADGARQKFTSQERDIESGLDYFLARYYSSTQGRFTSVDPLISSGEVADPQSWNRYSSVLNNPLTYTDPFGMYVFDKTVTDEQKKKFNAGLQEARENLNKIGEIYGTSSDKYEKGERALNVYGAEGVENGVTIGMAEGEGDGRISAAGITVEPTDANPTGQNIKVLFDAVSFNSESLAEMIAHEGSHAADGSDWIQSGFAKGANPTAYQSEVDAYTVSSLFAQAQSPTGWARLTLPHFKERGKNPYLPEFVTIWNAGWAEADRSTLRRAGIDRFLARPKRAGGLYGLTPLSKRLTFDRRTRN